jgi:hypothetical protein
MKRKLIIGMIALSLFVPANLFAQSLYRDTNRFSSGAQRLLLAPFQIPIQTFLGTARGPLVMGTLGGVLTGTFRTVGDLIGGVFDMGAAAVPYAKYGLFFI